MDSYSVAEARDNIAKILRAVESEGPVEITRRGRPVAVIISNEEYARLREGKQDFRQALARFNESAPPEDCFDDEFFEGLRDRSPGREVSL